MYCLQGDDPSWKGYLFTVGLGASTLAGALSGSFYWFNMKIGALKLSAGIYAAIYKKALSLSNSSRREKTGKFSSEIGFTFAVCGIQGLWQRSA